MKNYFVKKLAVLPLLLLGITAVSFLLLRALPGDPATSLVGERSSPEIIERISKELGSNKSVLNQYFGYLSLMARGEFGVSYYTNRPVLADLVEKFPRTLILAMAAMLVSVPVGLCIGLAGAASPGSRFDRFLGIFSSLLLSIPVFWAGLALMLLLGLRLHLLPPSGTGGAAYVVMPALTLSIPAIAGFSRVGRAAFAEAAAMPYVRTAAAKGAGQAYVFLVHVLRNALLPVITLIGLEFGSYLNGAVLTETIFGWDGVGRFAMDAVLKRDYPVIMGCIVLGTIVFVLVNMIVDILYHVVDPRVRKNGSAG